MKEIKQDVENCKVYKFQHGNRIIYFEKDDYVTHSQGFIVAKEKCNSIFIETGQYSMFSFDQQFVTEANVDEKASYLKKKSLSVYKIN